MPRPKSDQPGYRYHVSGQAVVTLDGKNFYLGPHNSPESRAKYYGLLGQYLANGKQLPPNADVRQDDASVTVRAVTGEYREYIKTRYAGRPRELSRLNNLCTLLELEFGDIEAEQFGPIRLNDLRETLVANGDCRTYVNRMIRHTKAIFRHAVSRELVNVNVVIRLDTLEPLRRGQTDAPEPRRVVPADLDAVRATAKHLSPTIKAMIQIQAATGMRPGEVCRMRPADIEKRSADCWLYCPADHKTAYRGTTKAVPIVGAAISVLAPFLDRDTDAYCFSPKESMAWFRAKQSASRVTPKSCGNRPGTNLKANPKKQPGEKYEPSSYRRAIAAAAERAKVPHWFPYQLRHMAGTAVRDALGIEAAQAFLGHSRANMTEHYARQAEAKAIEAAQAGPTI